MDSDLEQTACLISAMKSVNEESIVKKQSNINDSAKVFKNGSEKAYRHLGTNYMNKAAGFDTSTLISMHFRAGLSNQSSTESL